MSITTMAGVSSGLQPYRRIAKQSPPASTNAIFASAWYKAGYPAAGVADTSTANGVVRSSTSALVTGQIPHYDPASGTAYLANLSAGIAFILNNSVNGSTLALLDRLWDCGANSLGVALSPTLLTAQTVNSAAWPARDENSATSGVGVYIALEVSSNLGAGTSGWTISFTNSAGIAGLTGSNIQTQLGNEGIGAFHTFGLASGNDLGVKSVESVTNAATDTSGQYVLVAYRVLCLSDMQAGPGVSNAMDALTGGFTKLANGVVPFLCLRWSAGGGVQLSGIYQEAQG